MKTQIFSVYDEKAAAFLQPFFFNTVGQAVRAITDCTIEQDHQFSKHPADYTLFHLGEFDNQSGEITSDKKPLSNLLEYQATITKDNVLPLFPEKGDSES